MKIAIFTVIHLMSFYFSSAQYTFDYNEVANQLPNMSNIQSNFKNVIEGNFRFWQTSDCLSILYEDSPFTTYDGCYFQNPDAPYGLMFFPLHKDEVADKYYGFPVIDSNNYTGTWHMKKTDVIVLLGVTPPNCRYFSFSNYLYSRHYPEDWKPDQSRLHDLMCPDGDVADRCEIFASLDDSLNLDRGLMLSEQIFNTSFALIFSQSQEGTEFAKKGLIEAGVNACVISNYSFPGSELNLGVDTNDDTFINVMRTAFYENQTEADQYFSDIPFRVLRMEFNDDNVTIYNRRTLVNRTTTTTDASIVGITLQEMTKNLYNMIPHVMSYLIPDDIIHWNMQLTKTTSGTPDSGFDCINEGRMCLADCRDTLYPFSTQIYRRAQICRQENKTCFGIMDGLLTNQPDDVIVVLGINHKLTNMSSYASVSIYDSVYLWGTNTIGDEQLSNTSQKYINPLIPMKPTLQDTMPFIYVYEFRRDCGNRTNCLEVQSIPSLKSNAFIPYEDPISITERMYNNPETLAGPSPSNVVLPIVIHLKRRYQ